MTEVSFQTCSDRAEASQAAADLIASCIKQQLKTENRAGIVVSGGSTPGQCFDVLSRQMLPWSDVTIVPSDERWVDATHADSNERLIRSRLRQNLASDAKILPLFRPDRTAESAVKRLENDLRALLPFACVLLGMGEDGHFASLFPDFDDLATALNPDTDKLCTPVKTTASPYQRMSLTLAALRETQHTALLIFGEAKRKVFNQALKGESGYPIEQLLKQSQNPLTIFWAA